MDASPVILTAMPGPHVPAGSSDAADTAALREIVDPARIRDAVNQCLHSFLEHQEASAADGRLPPIVTRTLGEFLFAGGKRLRPTLCVLGYVAAGGDLLDEAVVKVAASLEMFHAFALIHDDVMDDSRTRRGRPTIHRTLASYYRAIVAGRGVAVRSHAAVRFGTAGAILLGDFALTWSDVMLNSSGLAAERLAAVRGVVDAMRVEVLFGQWLDMHAVGRPETDAAAPMTVAQYKTARYSFQRPLEVGAILAGADVGLLHSLERFAQPIGEAFQMRDDLLGVFGDPEVTGKPVGDDLRDGKRTVLLTIAYTRGDPGQRRTLTKYVGRRRLDATQVQEVRSVLIATGAEAEVERMIATRRGQALAAVESSGIGPEAARALRQIAFDATVRTA